MVASKTCYYPQCDEIIYDGALNSNKPHEIWKTSICHKKLKVKLISCENLPLETISLHSAIDR